MSFYDDASLVFLPSGGAGKDTKAYSIKPTDGSGDFTFSRGSNLTSTRVDSNGLIEKGRENLLLQSNQFDTTWATIGTSVTSGQSGYDGSSDAWLLESNNTTGAYISQNITASGVQTFSIYAKAGTCNFIYFVIRGSSNIASYFDLENGTIGTAVSTNIDRKIESIANGWYRCSITLSNTDTSVRVYMADADGSTTSALGSNIYIQDAQAEIGLAATEYIESGATTGKAGLLENEPRFDYSGGASCPSLLLEPSRTNVITYSEYFDVWNKGRSSVTSNAAVSPDGLVNASYFYDNTESGTHRLYSDTFSVTSGQSQSLTLYAKTGTFDKFRISVKALNESDLAFGIFDFDLTAGTCSNSDGSIESMGNGWYKCTAVGNVNASVSARMFIYLINDSDAVVYVGTGNDYIQIYGAQCESNVSYPTSYIPNHSGGSVTRNADELNDLDISSMLTSSNFTLFLDLNDYIGSDINSANVVLQSTSSGIYIEFRVRPDGYRFYYNGIVGGSTYPISGSTTANKFCVSYDGNDYRLYVDGTLEATTRSVGDSGWDKIRNQMADASLPLKQMLLFPSKLSDAECITLTS